MTEDDSDICSICLEKIIQSKQDLWTCLKCSNFVHEKCFNKWKLKQNTCPICRNDNKTIRKKENNNNKLYRVKLSFLILILAIYFNNFNISKTTDTSKNKFKSNFKNIFDFAN